MIDASTSDVKYAGSYVGNAVEDSQNSPTVGSPGGALLHTTFIHHRTAEPWRDGLRITDPPRDSEVMKLIVGRHAE